MEALLPRRTGAAVPREAARLWETSWQGQAACGRQGCPYPITQCGEGPAPLLLIQLPGNAGRAAGDGCNTPLTAETQVELQTPDLGLAQPWLVQAVWGMNESVEWKQMEACSPLPTRKMNRYQELSRDPMLFSS